MKGYLFVYTLTIIGILGSLFSPFLGICIYVLFGVMSPNALWYYSLDESFLNCGLGFSEVVAYPMIIGWVLGHFGNLNIGKAMLPLACLIAYTLWVILSSLATGWNYFGQAQILMNIRLLLAIVIALSLCDTVQRLRLLIWILVFGSGFVAYELNMSYFQGFNRLQMIGYAGMDNNFFAVSMVVGAVLSFFTGISEKNIYLKALAFFVALLQAHVIMFSMSRGGMLGLCVAGFCTFVILPKTPINMTIFLVALLVGISLAGPSVRERFFSAFANMEDLDGSAQSRLYSWKNCAIVMKERPLFGVGVKNWTSFSTGRFGIYLEAHSTWFQIAVDSGVPALLLVLGFFGFTMLRLLPYLWERSVLPDPKLRIYAQMTVVAVLAYGVSAQFVSLYAMESVFYTITVGMIVLKIIGLDQEARSQRETEELLAMQQEMGYSNPIGY